MLRKKSNRTVKSKSSVATAQVATQSGGSWSTGVALPSLLSSILLLSAFPPLNWFPLAWLGPIGWLVVCRRETPVGRKGYWAIWLSGCLFWLVTLHSTRLAFWALYVGWIALSLYLAVYVAAFVGATRLLVHRWRVPSVIAAPIAWTGCELIRSVVLTGYAANTLAHSQAFQPRTIQIVDQIGSGGLSFLMMMFAACVLELAVALRAKRLPRAFVQAGTATIVVLLIWGYGSWRLRQADQVALEKPMFRCLLLQEMTPSIFEVNPNISEFEDRSQAAWNRYAKLCRETVKQAGPVDLVVWPESMFTSIAAYIQWEVRDGKLPDDLKKVLDENHISSADLENNVAIVQSNFEWKVRAAVLAARGLESFEDLPAGHGPDLLVGCERARYTSEKVERMNSAIWIDSSGAINDYYDKMHLVLFGDYIPLRPLLGWLSDLLGFGGVEAGNTPKAFKIGSVRVAPNICFESMVPRLIRRQVQQLASKDTDPDVLINLTNDSWFKGTSMLDHHLASSIMCSVENHRPMLVAANTGISAEIDGSGRIVQSVDRLTCGAIIAEPRRDGRWSLVQSAGYPLSWSCAVVTLAVLLMELRPKTYASSAARSAGVTSGE